ncbi:MAG: hypothetical protein HFH28_08730 [Clostridiaceae bacterium]|nr:hypothetical protein [Clostridiaceae bacterium]
MNGFKAVVPPHKGLLVPGAGGTRQQPYPRCFTHKKAKKRSFQQKYIAIKGFQDRGKGGRIQTRPPLGVLRKTDIEGQRPARQRVSESPRSGGQNPRHVRGF